MYIHLVTFGVASFLKKYRIGREKDTEEARKYKELNLVLANIRTSSS